MSETHNSKGVAKPDFATQARSACAKKCASHANAGHESKPQRLQVLCLSRSTPSQPRK